MAEVLRRLRRTEGLRSLFTETRISPRQLIYPMFVREGLSGVEPIESMPGMTRYGLDSLDELGRKCIESGIGGLLVFGLPSQKDSLGTSALDDEGIVPKAVRALKQFVPELPIITDVCLCGYTDHGHCGVLTGESLDILETQRRLSEMAVSHAQAGADLVAPSSMVDGQVQAIRAKLDQKGFAETAIMGYSAKFASAFYGPFREAADSAPVFGDRKAYQHHPANLRHAKREIVQDALEGADAVMVKPGLPYLDVVRTAREVVDLPIAVYQVSGEYSMIKAAGERGWIDEQKVILESLTAFGRAGADHIISYFALEAAPWLK